MLYAMRFMLSAIIADERMAKMRGAVSAVAVVTLRRESQQKWRGALRRASGDVTAVRACYSA